MPILWEKNEKKRLKTEKRISENFKLGKTIYFIVCMRKRMAYIIPNLTDCD